jgi:hypothetical protein
MLEGGLTLKRSNEVPGTSARAQKHLTQHVPSADETWKS